MTGLPRVAIEKLLRDVVPEHLALQKETVDWATECAAEFLRIVGKNANAAAEAGAKSEKYRVNADHVVQALEQMDMAQYLSEVESNGHGREEASKQKRQRAASRKAALQTASREELLAEQNALFQQASSQAARQGW